MYPPRYTSHPDENDVPFPDSPRQKNSRLAAACEVLTGVTDQHRACELLAEWGVKEVLLTLGSYGSVVYADGRFYDIPAYDPLNVVDATGCGDTYVMAYVYRRLLGDDPGQAGRFASAVASIKLEASGPFCGTEADALARLKP